MKILILYAGIGGIRKLWGNDHEITAVEINPEVAAVYKRYFPLDTVIIGDAHQYLLDHYKEYDLIQSSPPCQSHSAMQRINTIRYNLARYPDMKLYQEIIFLKNFYKGLYCVENVKPYYTDLIPPDYKLNRHYIWSNFRILPHKKKNINSFIDAKYEDLKKWLGYEDFNEKIYLKGNHDYSQVLRNCVHPESGLHILNCALNKYSDKQIYQGTLFESYKN